MAVEACIRLEQTRALARRSCVLLLLLLQQEKRRVRGGGGMKVGWNGTMPCTWYFKRRIPSEPTLLLQSTDNDNRFDFCTHARSLSLVFSHYLFLWLALSLRLSLSPLSLLSIQRDTVCAQERRRRHTYSLPSSLSRPFCKEHAGYKQWSICFKWKGFNLSGTPYPLCDDLIRVLHTYDIHMINYMYIRHISISRIHAAPAVYLSRSGVQFSDSSFS